MDLRDYYKLLRRKKWIALTVFVIVMIFYSATTLSKPRLFIAVSSIVISPPSLEKTLLKNISGASSFELLPPAQLRLISTQDFSVKVSQFIKKSHKAEIPPREVFASRIISTIEQTTIQILVKHKNKDAAKWIANAYAELSVEENKHFASAEYDRAQEYLQKKMKEYKKRMTDTEAALNEINQKEGVIDFNQDLQNRIQRLASYEAHKEELNMQKGELERSLLNLKSSLAMENPKKTITDVIPNPDLADFKAQLMPLETQHQELSQYYTGSHPKMVLLQKRIETLKTAMGTKISKYVEVPKTVDNSRYLSMENLLIGMELNNVSLAVRDDLLNTLIATEKQGLSKLGGKDIDYARKLREKETAERLYYSLYDTLEQMRVSAVMKSGNAYIAERSHEAYPQTRSTRTQLAFMIVMGAMVGVSVSVVLELLDDTVKMPYHVRRYLNVQVLGSIPRINEQEHRLLLNLSSKSPVSEAYNRLAYQIQKHCLEKHIKSLVTSSARESEGKSTIVSNIAVALASMGERVILVDADLRRPTIHKLFSVSNAYGLSSFLSGEVQAKNKLEQIEQQGKTKEPSTPDNENLILSLLQNCPNRDGLMLLTSGPLVQSPVEALNQEEMKTVVGVLKKHASRVLIDAPPILGVIDAGIIGGITDAALVVLDATAVKRFEAVRSREMFSSLGIKVVGAILNNVEMGDDEGYYYYYRSGYRVGHT